MKVYEKIKIDMSTGKVIEEKCFNYHGPVAFCYGGGEEEFDRFGQISPFRQRQFDQMPKPANFSNYSPEVQKLYNEWMIDPYKRSQAEKMTNQGFDPFEYLTMYPDVGKSAYGRNLQRIQEHYRVHGKGEGRAGTFSSAGYTPEPTPAVWDPWAGQYGPGQQPPVIGGPTGGGGAGGVGGGADYGFQPIDPNAPPEDILSQIAAGYYNVTGPSRNLMVQQGMEFLEGGYDPTTSPVWGAGKNAAEVNYALAREQMMQNMPSGGLLRSQLSQADLAKSRNLTDLAASVGTDQYNRIYGLATGAPQISMSGLGTAGMIEAQKQAAAQQASATESAGKKSGMGALGSGIGSFAGSMK